MPKPTDVPWFSQPKWHHWMIMFLLAVIAVGVIVIATCGAIAMGYVIYYRGIFADLAAAAHNGNAISTQILTALNTPRSLESMAVTRDEQEGRTALEDFSYMAANFPMAMNLGIDLMFLGRTFLLRAQRSAEVFSGREDSYLEEESDPEQADDEEGDTWNQMQQQQQQQQAHQKHGSRELAEGEDGGEATGDPVPENEHHPAKKIKLSMNQRRKKAFMDAFQFTANDLENERKLYMRSLMARSA